MIDLDALDIDLEDIALDVDLDSAETGVLTSYQQKKYLHSQLSNLIIISLAYCSSVAFRNALVASFLLSFGGSESGLTVTSLTLYAALSTIFGILATFLLSRKESNDEADQYVKTQKIKFEIEKQKTDTLMLEYQEKKDDAAGGAGASSDNIGMQRKTAIDLMFEEIIDISLKLEAMADGVLDSLWGKLSGFVEHCFAFASAYGWKEAIYTLFFFIYDEAWLILVCGFSRCLLCLSVVFWSLVLLTGHCCVFSVCCCFFDGWLVLVFLFFIFYSKAVTVDLCICCVNHCSIIDSCGV